MFNSSENKSKATIEQEKNNLVGRIHPNDDMLFKIEGKPINTSIDHYVSVGLSALENIQETLDIAEKKFDDIKFCLDFPCGYGRVLRVLQTKIKPNLITACDINEEAVRYCNYEFGAEPFLSNDDFKKIIFHKKYDLIWVGSLFTHLNSQSFSILLEILYDVLENGGILIFTTHGEFSLELIDNNNVAYGIQFPEREKIKEILRNKGYYHIPYPHSKDYGISICLPEYVLSATNKIFGNKLKLLIYKYKGWDNHQDVYGFQRIASSL